MTWKQFKTWLDKNIIESKELTVKIKPEKQREYGDLSTVTLTNFCDSLEATLDNNTSYHLFPKLTEGKNFREIFNYQNCYFGKKTLEQGLNKSDYDLLEKLFNDWKSTKVNNNENINKNAVRNILLIGRTGSGKSTLANVLMGTDKFIESAKSISVTKNIEEGLVEIDLKEDGSEKVKYRVIDTIGIGDTKLTPLGVLTRLAQVAGRVKKEGLNQILFITRGRFSNEEIEAYDLLSSIIFDKEVLKYTTVVRVGFPEFEEQEICDEDRWELREENPKLAHILNSVKVIYLDNPPLKGRNAETNKEVRKESRRRLLIHLATCEGNYRPSNIDTLDERVNSYRTNEQKLKDKMKELEKSRKEQEEKFRKDMAELKEQQTKELKELREKAAKDLHDLEVKSDEKLRKTKNEMEDEQKKKINELEEKNKEELRQSEERGKQEIKKVEETMEKQKKDHQEDLKKHSEEVSRLREDLSKKNDNTELLTKMMEQNRKDEQARQERMETQRLESERKERQERRDADQKRLDAENQWRREQATKEDQRRNEEKQAEAKRQEIERKTAKMNAAWKKWEEDKKSFLEEQDGYFWGRESNWREKMPKPPSGDYNDYK